MIPTLAADPSGPPDTRPPNKPGTPPPPKDHAELDSIALLLRTCELVADRKLAGVDPALRMALVVRLRLARRSVHDLMSPARRDPFSAAVGADAIATPGGPGRPRVGQPPLPGAGFELPDVRREPEFAVGVASVYPRNR